MGKPASPAPVVMQDPVMPEAADTAVETGLQDTIDLLNEQVEQQQEQIESMQSILGEPDVTARDVVEQDIATLEQELEDERRMTEELMAEMSATPYWEEREEIAGRQARIDVINENRRRRGFEDLILTSPLLDEDEPTVLTQSLIGG